MNNLMPNTRLEKLEDVAQKTRLMISTLEKLMKLCDVDFVITINGQEHAVDVTKEVKAALEALDQEDK